MMIIDWSKPLEVIDKETGERWHVERVDEYRKSRVLHWENELWNASAVFYKKDPEYHKCFRVVNAPEAK